jgi:hypothetical protein
LFSHIKEEKCNVNFVFKIVEYTFTPTLLSGSIPVMLISQSTFINKHNSGHDYLEVETEKEVKVFDTLLYQELVKEVVDDIVEDIVYLLQRISFCSERCLQEFSFFLKFPYFFQVRTGCLTHAILEATFQALSQLLRHFLMPEIKCQKKA